MARVVPDSAYADPDITVGERKLLRALQYHLDDSALVWYQPHLKGSRRPDVIAYVPGIGLLLFEVKDWSLGHVVSATADVWTIRHEGKERAQTNPLKQAKGYFYGLKERLQGERSLVDDGPLHMGKLKLPVATVVVFPNMGRVEYEAAGYGSVIEPRFVLCKEELAAIGAALTGKALIDRLRACFDPWWPHDELGREDLDRLRAVLYPEITSRQKEKGGRQVAIVLDEYQEQVAKKLGEGHRIVRGVAGSGKSLVLCAKIRMLLAEHPDWRILLTCYNVSLASQLRHYLNSFADTEGEAALRSREQIARRVDVLHYHALCGKIFRETRTPFPRLNKEQTLATARFGRMAEHEQVAELDEMESALLGQELQRVAATRPLHLYDAIVVDESQDFHTSWLRSLTLLLNGRTNFLLLAEDPNQKIYPRKFSYREAGIEVVGGGRVFNLPVGYRSTREIVTTASKLVKTSNWDEFYRKFIEEAEGYGDETPTKRAGGYPEVVIRANYEDLCDYIVQDIQTKLKQGYKHQDFGIIYLTQTRQAAGAGQLALPTRGEPINYVTGVRGRLALHGIKHFWLSQNKDSKGAYDQFRDAVTISTLFSAKGLEFEVVYLVGMELYPWGKRSARENASMLYVGMTRAKERLVLLSTEQTGTVETISGIIGELRGAAPATARLSW